MSLSDAGPLDLPAVVAPRMAHPGSHASRGWWPVLEELDARLSEIDLGYRLNKVKGKWGSSVSTSLTKVVAVRKQMPFKENALLAAFERRSGSVCQVCGALEQRSSRRVSGDHCSA
jgi:hypothetical protein